MGISKTKGSSWEQQGGGKDAKQRLPPEDLVWGRVKAGSRKIINEDTGVQQSPGGEAKKEKTNCEKVYQMKKSKENRRQE